MLYNFLTEYKEKNIYPFHMPGHKGNREFLPKTLFGCDITEIPGADNLYAPTGIIGELQKKIARIFGADESMVLVNGSSTGVLASLMYASAGGRPIIMARNSHRSAYNALILSGAKPVYVVPEMTEFGFAAGISVEAVKNAIGKNRNAAAVFITSPTYEGVVSDIKGIADAAHKNGMMLIVDEAHGAHFAFSDFFPESAVSLGADIVVQSLHKTLPVLGQAAVLHFKTKERGVRQLVPFVQTSSPSYLLLAQVDYALNKLLMEERWFEEYADMLNEFRAKASLLNSIALWDGGKGADSIFDADSSKLVFTLNGTELNGEKLDWLLRKNYRVQLEMSGLSHAIAMTSPADNKEGFDRLYRGLTEIERLFCSCKSTEGIKRKTNNREIFREPPDIVLSPKAAFESEKELVPLKQAAGKIAGNFVIPYPPGIPLIAPGERISEKLVEQITVCAENGICLMGYTEDGIQTLKVNTKKVKTFQNF